MSEPIIRIENLGKKYFLKHQQGAQRYHALRDVLAHRLKTGFGLWGRNGTSGSSTEEFWALKEINFEVNEGEVMGIIGRNGAGKSTLLKVLSRITEPTTGRVTLNGRVASLLEVGTGFHPELTGRENIFLNGSILGMTRREIAQKFDEIVAFADVEKFLDTPVKRYSSGMYVRLAFAVAAHLEPEILVVDEVLAVGDAAFQKKCLGKMGEVAKGGRTVLFVSHNMGVIQSLCQSVVRLQAGQLVGRGNVADQILEYQADFQNTDGSKTSRVLGPDLQLEQLSAEPASIVSCEPVSIHVSIRATCDTTVSGLCVLIYSAADVRTAILDMRRAEGPYRLTEGQSLSVHLSVASFTLVEGEYALGLFIESTQSCMNVLDISRIDVLPRPFTDEEVAPYKVMYRGFVELPRRIDHVSIQ
jgi:lipopolysaccharide transport system ATP-binding protein